MAMDNRQGTKEQEKSEQRNKGTGGQGDKEKRSLVDKEIREQRTRGPRDQGTRRQGDKEKRGRGKTYEGTRRQGDRGTSQCVKKGLRDHGTWR